MAQAKETEKGDSPVRIRDYVVTPIRLNVLLLVAADMRQLLGRRSPQTCRVCEGLRSRHSKKKFADSRIGNWHEGHLLNLKSPLARTTACRLSNSESRRL